MTTSTKNHSFYGEYINPTVDQYSIQKENPLVLMAEACNNIGKDLSLPTKQHSSPPRLLISKQRKSHSPPEGKKSLKRLSSSTTSPILSTKKPSTCQSSYINPLLLFNLNKIFSSAILPLNSSSSSTLFPSLHQSSYLIDSILSSPFICNWMDSTIQDGFCGKRFKNHMHLLEHICTEHTQMKSSYPFYSSLTSIEKL